MASEMSEQPFLLTSLPLPLPQRIFLRLPVDQRGRACCVCRAWRDALADPELWTQLDLTEESGVVIYRLRDAQLLRGAAARAQGRLHTLDVRFTYREWSHDMEPALLEVLTANTASLRVLRVRTLRLPLVDYGDDSVCALALLNAAPRLERLDADVSCNAVDMLHLMRGEAPWDLLARPLRIQSLEVIIETNDAVPAVAAVLADATLQPALSTVVFSFAHITEPPVLDALVDGLLARHTVRALELGCCTQPAAAPLARLLAGGALTTLKVNVLWNRAHTALFDEAGAALVADALRANTTLTTLEFKKANLCEDVAAACTVLGALVGHPSLSELVLWNEVPPAEGHAALGAALAALVTADAPALEYMEIINVDLGGASLEPFVNALRRNRHLRKLRFSPNGLSEEFKGGELLPVIRANSGLQLLLCYPDPADPVITEAMKLVADRAQRS